MNERITTLSIRKKSHLYTIKVHIVSDQINVLKDHDGNIIEGSTSMVVNNNDLWTFSRNIQKDKIWFLVGTNVI